MDKPTFTTPCFVRIYDPCPRREVVEMLQEKGYELIYDDYDGNVVSCNNGMFSSDYMILSIGLQYDCGIDITLFLELASMKSTTDKDQLFICTSDHITPSMMEYKRGDIKRCSTEKSNPKQSSWRRATAKEIINHYKQQK